MIIEMSPKIFFRLNNPGVFTVKFLLFVFLLSYVLDYFIMERDPFLNPEITILKP